MYDFPVIQKVIVNPGLFLTTLSIIGQHQIPEIIAKIFLRKEWLTSTMVKNYQRGRCRTT